MIAQHLDNARFDFLRDANQVDILVARLGPDAGHLGLGLTQELGALRAHYQARRRRYGVDLPDFFDQLLARLFAPGRASTSGLWPSSPSASTAISLYGRSPAAGTRKAPSASAVSEARTVKNPGDARAETMPHELPYAASAEGFGLRAPAVETADLADFFLQFAAETELDSPVIEG